MKLYSRTVYRTDGQDFDSLKRVRAHLETEIGKILDSVPNRLHAKDALAVHAAIIAHRERLVDLLTVELESDDWDGEPRNVLSLDL